MQCLSPSPSALCELAPPSEVPSPPSLPEQVSRVTALVEAPDLQACQQASEADDAKQHEQAEQATPEQHKQDEQAAASQQKQDEPNEHASNSTAQASLIASMPRTTQAPQENQVMCKEEGEEIPTPATLPPAILSDAAIMQRLRRIFKPRANGQYLVAEQFIAMWHDLDGGRDKLKSLFEKSAYSPEPMGNKGGGSKLAFPNALNYI